MCRLRPRILVDVSSVNTSTTVLGFRIAMPIMVAPAALHKLAHPEGRQEACSPGSSMLDLFWNNYSRRCRNILSPSLFLKNCNCKWVQMESNFVVTCDRWIMWKWDDCTGEVATARAVSAADTIMVLTARMPLLQQILLVFMWTHSNSSWHILQDFEEHGIPFHICLRQSTRSVLPVLQNFCIWDI